MHNYKLYNCDGFIVASGLIDCMIYIEEKQMRYIKYKQYKTKNGLVYTLVYEK